MKKEEFLTLLERGLPSVTGLPVTSSILSWTIAQLKNGEPPWWKGVSRAWEKRSFEAWTESWSLYLTALHYEALNDAQCPLVRYFPSCGGTAEADPASALNEFFKDPPASFFENLKNRHRRTYVSARASMWLSPAMLYFQLGRELPYYVVEVNSGAGLNLASDLISKAKGFDSDLVSARIGLDPQPLDMSSVTDLRWLTAGIWPDNLPAIKELDTALKVVEKRCQDEAAFIQLAPCPAENAAVFVAKNIPHDDDEVGLLMLNMASTVRMSDAQYNAYSQSMATLLKNWGNRGLWVEIETARGEKFASTHELRAHRYVEGSLKSFVMATFNVENGTKSYNEKSPDFLKI